MSFTQSLFKRKKCKHGKHFIWKKMVETRQLIQYALSPQNRTSYCTTKNGRRQNFSKTAKFVYCHEFCCTVTCMILC